MVMAKTVHLVTGKYEVQNQANAQKGCLPVQLNLYTTTHHITI